MLLVKMSPSELSFFKTLKTDTNEDSMNALICVNKNHIHYTKIECGELMSEMVKRPLCLAVTAGLEIQTKTLQNN